MLGALCRVAPNIIWFIAARIHGYGAGVNTIPFIIYAQLFDSLNGEPAIGVAAALVAHYWAAFGWMDCRSI